MSLPLSFSVAVLLIKKIKTVAAGGDFSALPFEHPATLSGLIHAGISIQE